MLVDSLRFFKSQYIAIATIVLPFVIPVEIFEVLYMANVGAEQTNFQHAFLPMLLDVLTYPIYTAAVIFYIASVIEGKAIGIKTAWKLGMSCWFSFFALNIMVSSLVFLGVIMFIVPGLFFLVRYAFSEFELCLGQHAPLNAMRNSWAATSQYMGPILGGFVIIIVGLYAPFYFLVALLKSEEYNIAYLVNVIDVLYAVLEAVYTIFIFRVYCYAKEQGAFGPS